MHKIILILALCSVAFALNAVAPAVHSALDAADYPTAIALLQAETAQDGDIESWRLLGYAYRMQGNLSEAVSAYAKVLEQNSTDYDARLALARLNLQKGDFKTAKALFNGILDEDKTDVEAWRGLASIAQTTEDYPAAVEACTMALSYLPNDIPTMLQLARMQSFCDMIDDAIETYLAINDLDATWAEAWAGLGRMMWWQDNPHSAMGYYQKALRLDPENADIQKEYQNAKNAVKWSAVSGFSRVQEREETVTTDGYNQQYKLQKRLTDNLNVALNSFWQYSQKKWKQSNSVEEKWFDTNFAQVTCRLHPGLQVSTTCGGSISDSVLTIWDAGVAYDVQWKGLKLKNNFRGGTEYFFHWEHLSRWYMTNNFSAQWQKLTFSSDYTSGKVKETLIWEDTTLSEIPFLNYALTLSYLLYQPAKLNLGASYRFMDFAYESSQFYTPQNRSLVGANISFYYPCHQWYLYGASSVEEDNNDEFGYSNNLEVGVNIAGLSISAGYSNFKNPYYESDSVSLTVSGRF